MPFDPFQMPDPFGAFGAGARRTPAFPALPDAEAESLIGSMTDFGLSSLGYAGSLLDKLGGRAVRGTLAGNPRELLSVLPFSDTLGITDPSQIKSGRDVLESWGALGPNEEGLDFGDVAGFGAEVALDPTTWFGGIGALTAAGKVARKTGSLTKGLIPAVAKGERSIHPLLALAPPSVQAAAGELPGKVAAFANVGLRKLPGVAPVEDVLASGLGKAKVGLRSLFDPAAGPYPHAAVQASHEAAYLPEKARVERQFREAVAQLYKGYDDVLAKGVDPNHLYRYVTRALEGVAQPPGGLLTSPHLQDVDNLVAMASSIRDLFRTEELAKGIRSPELKSVYDLEYALRQAVRAPGSDGGGFLKKLLETSNKSQLRRKEIFDLPGGSVQLEDLVSDPAMTLAARTRGGRAVVGRKVQDLLLDPYGLSAGQFGPLHPDEVKRITRQSRGLADYLGRVKDDFIRTPTNPEPLPFFKHDVPGNLLLRGQRSGAVQGGAEGVYDLIGRTFLRGSGPDTTGMLDLLRKAGLSREPAYRRALQAVGENPDALFSAAQQAAAKAGKEVDPVTFFRSALKNYSLPADAAGGATSLMTRYAAPTEVGGVLGWFDSLLRGTKTGLYTVFPASHFRDLGSNLYETALEGGDPRLAGAADRLLKGGVAETGVPLWAGLSPQDQAYALRKSAFVHKVIDPMSPQGRLNERFGLRVPEMGSGSPFKPLPPSWGIVKDFLDVTGTAKDTGKRVAAMAGGTPVKSALEVANPAARGGRALGREISDSTRLGHYWSLLKQGYTEGAAAELVNKAQLDYDLATDFERNFMRRVVPFYTFSRQNIPKQVQRAVERPMTLQTPIRAVEAAKGGDQEYTPEYLRSGLAVPLGRNEDGTREFLSQLGLPFEEAFGHLKVGNGPLDTLAKTSMNLLSSARPEIRGPLEAMTGTQFWTGRKLADLEPGKVARGVTLGNEDAANLASMLIGNTPASRAVSTVNSLLDERKPGAGKLLKLFTGARVTDVDTDKWRAIDAREKLGELLSGMPYIKEARDFYADPAHKAEVTAGERELLQLQNYQREKAREAAKNKRVGVRGGGN